MTITQNQNTVQIIENDFVRIRRMETVHQAAELKAQLDGMSSSEIKTLTKDKGVWMDPDNTTR